jgi:hypothetical protein
MKLITALFLVLIKMGQNASVCDKCVFLTDYPNLLNDSYTVERSNNSVESGWHIPSQSTIVPLLKGPSASIHIPVRHAMKDGWRIFMENGAKNPNEVIGGWRRIKTVWPTRLNGDIQAIMAWHEETIKLLEALELLRV